MRGASLIFFAACALGLSSGARIKTDVTSVSDKEAEFNEYADLIRAGAQTGEPTYNEQFFEDNCDLSEHRMELFQQPKYKLNEDEESDNKKWENAMKCENSGNGLDPITFNDFTQGRYDCAKQCSQLSAAHAGKVVCCEHDVDRKMCEVRIGWQSLEESNYAVNKFNPANWIGRHAKVARLFFTAAPDEAYVPLAEGEEMTKAKEGRNHMRSLMDQVNHMSIDGILDHMLSFYICMRWVPDEEFVKLAQWEVQHVSVDQSTPLNPDTSRDDILKMYLNSDLIPLKCGSAINVKRLDEISELQTSLNLTSSTFGELYRFSRAVHDAGTRGLFEDTRVKNTLDAMHYDPEKGTDSVFVSDMRAQARHEKVLPWSTLLRPSQQFSHHVSQPKNLFMMCFGPRVASYPHKREGGPHVLADMNMAGCNGFWDLPTMVDHMDRMKKLFSPEMCFEYELRKELKAQFMRTFVAMNEEFEKAIGGVYNKRLHDLDPLKSHRLNMISDRQTDFEDVRGEGTWKVGHKYSHVAGLVAKAHSKWIICPAKDPAAEAFGAEDNFFRDPKAYEKWIGELGDETVPECKTLDESTGCVKCAIAVKDMHSCHVRLNVHLPDIWKAIKERKYSFLQSKYKTQEEVVNEKGGTEYRVVTKKGACLARKSHATTTAAVKTKDLETIQNSFFQVNDTDNIVQLWGFGDVQRADREGFVGSTVRMDVSDRRAALAHWLTTGGSVEEDTDLDVLADAMGGEHYSDEAPNKFAEKFIFTDVLPELSNRPAHKVDYFLSCPCSKTDFAPNAFFATSGSQGMAEYYNR